MFEFGLFQLDPVGRTLSHAGELVPLAPKLYETLLVLVERRGEVLGKDELLELIWPDSFVEENNLSQSIFQLRKILGAQAGDQAYIETISRRGYRFVGEVREVGVQISEPSPTTHIIPAPLPTKNLPPRVIGLGMVGVVLLVALFIGWRQFWPRPLPGSFAAPFANPRITKLTNTLDVRAPALSRDGKYLAYVVAEAGRQSIRLRQTIAGNEVQVVVPAEVRYRGLTFAPEGDFLYCTYYEKASVSGQLARVPVLGGTPARINNDADSPVTFSPDGKQMAFARYFSESAIVVANVDGSHERKLAVRQKPDMFAVDGPAWSPDGNWIACAVGNHDAPVPYMTLVGVDTKTGQETRFTSQRFSGLSQVAWLPEGQGLMAVVADTTAPLAASQVWHFAWPGDSTRRITNDMNAWRWVSLPQQAEQLVTVQSARVAQFQLVPDGDASQAKDITFGSGDGSGEKLGVTWTPDGKLVYASHLNGNTDLWLMNADGSKRRQLTENPGADYQPAVSPDGRYLLFASARANPQSNIWRMELQSGHLQQLTFGKDDENPAVTPDGKWVLYTTRGQGHWTMWKVPLAGGTAQQVTRLPTQKPMVSPDGKLIAGYFYDEAARSYRLALLPMEGGQVIRFFAAPMADLLPIYWMPDGRALTYVDTREGISNLWRQPIDGSAPQQMTQFKTGRIFRYAWSPDGKMLVCERGTAFNDLVLISQER